MMPENNLPIRLTHLTIKNYKKIDSLEIDFPRPLMKGDADILVFGSKNGGGKTSIIECCALLILAGVIGEKLNRFRESGELLDIANLLVKAGKNSAILKANFEKNEKQCFVSLVIQKNGNIEISRKDDISLLENKSIKSFFPIENILNSIFAFSSEPLIIYPLLYFNSYRKVQESKPELGMMAEDYSADGLIRTATGVIVRSSRIRTTSVSSFKLEILRALMGQASLFEGFRERDSEVVLSQLNILVEHYCNGRIENLRPLADNKVDIRIKPINDGESFSFDGLSSGQKEMIATLFLIWKNTQNQPSIVLIDEPELHLNAEWQSDFIQQLYQLAPHNQYILATHSEAIFRSVDEEYRAMLVPDDNEV